MTIKVGNTEFKFDGYFNTSQTIHNLAEKCYQQGREDEIVKFILTLQEIYDYVWDRDIPSPTCPEYKEHHDDCIEIMAKIKDKIYQLKEQQA